jgi:hypothetical protein
MDFVMTAPAAHNAAASLAKTVADRPDRAAAVLPAADLLPPSLERGRVIDTNDLCAAVTQACGDIMDAERVLALERRIRRLRSNPASLPVKEGAMASRGAASHLAHRLVRDTEAVCREYLSNGRREGSDWMVGDVYNAQGRSMHVSLKSPGSGRGAAAGKWVESVAALVMSRICDRALSHSRSTASTQHNVSAPREVS